MNSKWMLFVDGENFAIEGQKLLKERIDSNLCKDEVLYSDKNEFLQKDVFLWAPGWAPLTTCSANRLFHSDNSPPWMSYYYTTTFRNEEYQLHLADRLKSVGFNPVIFSKNKANKDRRTKGLDISIATDMLSHGFRNNYETVCLVAGDADYSPLVEALTGIGKRVIVAFFGEEFGLSSKLKGRAYRYKNIEVAFCTSWRGHLENLKRLIDQEKEN